MDEAVNEGDGGAGVREDVRSVAESQIGGEDEAALFVTTADDLEEQVGVAAVVRKVSQFGDYEL